MAKVQGCRVSDAPARQLSLSGVRSLRTPSAGSGRRQPAYRSWAAPSRGSAQPPGAAVQPGGMCPIGRDGSLVSRLAGLVAEGEGLRLQPRGTPRCRSPGRAAVPGQAGAQGQPPCTQELEAAGTGEARQALSAERDAYKQRAAILCLLSGLPIHSPGAAVRGGGGSGSPRPAPPRRQPRAAQEVPSGKRPPAPAAPAPAFSLPPPP